jgi:BON domain
VGHDEAVGVLRRTLPVMFPVTRMGVALWAWRNRNHIFGWTAYAARSLPKLRYGSPSDVLTEGRLRARLTANFRTRNAHALQVDVTDGVATLSGAVDPDVHAAAVETASTTSGITRVRDEIMELPPRRRGFLSRR